jgi:hypothetical protein
MNIEYPKDVLQATHEIYLICESNLSDMEKEKRIRPINARLIRARMAASDMDRETYLRAYETHRNLLAP